ncbi:D-Ala-D-Ala carboxypeptidase family metallohydrolase [Bradyrhizobium liaoningense]
MPAVDKVLFANFCLRQANFCGVNTHYLAAVAQLRSQINDDVVNDEIGPYRFTQVVWDQNRKNQEFAPDFESEDVHSWRMQVSVFARMTSGVLGTLVGENGGRSPSALELYEAQLKAGGSRALNATQRDKLADELDIALQETRAAVTRAEATELDDVQMPVEPGATPQTILFRRVPGLAVPQGHLITKMQTALIQRGHLPAIDEAGRMNADGVFGPMTENAVEAWQTATGHPSTGALTHGEWRELTGLPVPDIYERCAQLTAAFEGTGFGGTNPTDFDNTILTFGYHGYTLTGGNLQNFLKEMHEKHPDLLVRTFGAAKAQELRSLFPPVPIDQVVSLGKQMFLSGDRIKQEWRTAFKRFGETPECQAGQIDFSRRVYWSLAERMRGILSLSSSISHALCFDVAIQNGDKTRLARSTATRFQREMGEPERRIAFGKAIVAAANPQFQSDVRARKVSTLGEGDGVVHEAHYRLDNWGFAESESAESNDAPDPTFPPPDNAVFSAFFASRFPGLTAFSANEFLVKGAKHAINHLNTDPPQVLWPNIVRTVEVLVELKKRLGNPAITLNSVFRSRAYNESVGGARNSQHVKFAAVDLVAHDGKTPREWAAALHQMRNEGFFSGGIGLYRGFVHVDTRGFNADWG